MTLVLFLCGLFILINLILLILVASSIKINIKSMVAQNTLDSGTKHDFNIDIGICIFNKMSLFVIHINKSKIKKSKIYKKIKNAQTVPKIETIKNIGKLSPKIKQLDLNIKLGTEDAVITSTINTILNILISTLLPIVADYKDYKNIRYEIQPVYSGKNAFELKLKSIIYIKIVHIISIIFIIFQKRRCEKNERSSNRRTYANCHE